MAAPTGNQYWKFRDKHGRDFEYTPEFLWDEFSDYSEWVESNPLYEEKPFSYQGEIHYARVAKMRAMTIAAFCLFADITERTWRNYKENEDFFPVTTRIENAIRSQKFEGAAAELLNSNIIARDLGLIDKTEQTHSMKGTPTFNFNNLNGKK